MEAEQFTVRLAGSDEDPAIATLVVEGFLDKFRPVFGRRMDRSVRIMDKWIGLADAFTSSSRYFWIRAMSASKLCRSSDPAAKVFARGSSSRFTKASKLVRPRSSA